MRAPQGTAVHRLPFLGLLHRNGRESSILPASKAAKLNLHETMASIIGVSDL
jgi:hypothetical protein